MHKHSSEFLRARYHLRSKTKLIADAVYANFQLRRHYFFSFLSKQVKELVSQVPPQEYLFGSNLGEIIQQAKAIDKVGKELKVGPAYPARPPVEQRTRAATWTQTSRE